MLKFIKIKLYFGNVIETLVLGFQKSFGCKTIDFDNIT